MSGVVASMALPMLGCVRLAHPPLRVGAIPWPGYECLFLARALGLWAQMPLKLVDYPTSAEAIRAFLNGALEAIAITGDEFMRLATDEPAVRAILVTDFSNGADALIARPEFNSVQSLRGKRVGVEVNAAGVYMLKRALHAAGMAVRDIEIVALEKDDQAAAFAARKVDAVATYEPARTQVLETGGHVLFDSSQIPGEICDLLVTRADILEKRLDLFRELVQSWFDARDFLLGRTIEAARIIAPHENLSPRQFAEALKLISVPSLDENRKLLREPESELIKSLLKSQRMMQQADRSITAVFPAQLLEPRVLA